MGRRSLKPPATAYAATVRLTVSVVAPRAIFRMHVARLVSGKIEHTKRVKHLSESSLVSIFSHFICSRRHMSSFASVGILRHVSVAIVWSDRSVAIAAAVGAAFLFVTASGCGCAAGAGASSANGSGDSVSSVGEACVTAKSAREAAATKMQVTFILKMSCVGRFSRAVEERFARLLKLASMTGERGRLWSPPQLDALLIYDQLAPLREQEKKATDIGLSTRKATSQPPNGSPNPLTAQFSVMA